MYATIRIIRIIVALLAMAVPTWALICGYDSVFVRMQILTALISGAAVCLIFWAAVTIIYGRIYCSLVCPLGTAMDCTAAIMRVGGRRKNFFFRPDMGRTRIVFVIIAFALMLTGSATIPALLDPYSAYARMVTQLIVVPLGLQPDSVIFSLSATGIAAATAIVIAVCSWRRGRIICNSVCPVGTLLGAASRHAVFHIDINTDRCINCGECERVCKAECIDLDTKSVDLSRCVVCFDCTAVCPNNAIIYRTGRHRVRTPLMQPTSSAKNITK